MQGVTPVDCMPERCSISFAKRAMARVARQRMAGWVSRSDASLVRRNATTRLGAARYATPISLK